MQATLCTLIMDIGFMNLIQAITSMTAEEWCEDITMCKKETPFATFGIDHCSACVDMVDDVSLIAQVLESKNFNDHFEIYRTAM